MIVFLLGQIAASAYCVMYLLHCIANKRRLAALGAGALCLPPIGCGIVWLLTAF